MLYPPGRRAGRGASCGPYARRGLGPRATPTARRPRRSPAAGLEVHTWVVLAHNSRLGAELSGHLRGQRLRRPLPLGALHRAARHARVPGGPRRGGGRPPRHTRHRTGVLRLVRPRPSARPRQDRRGRARRRGAVPDVAVLLRGLPGRVRRAGRSTPTSWPPPSGAPWSRCGRRRASPRPGGRPSRSCSARASWRPPCCACRVARPPGRSRPRRSRRCARPPPERLPGAAARRPGAVPLRRQRRCRPGAHPVRGGRRGRALHRRSAAPCSRRSPPQRHDGTVLAANLTVVSRHGRQPRHARRGRGTGARARRRRNCGSTTRGLASDADLAFVEGGFVAP